MMVIIFEEEDGVGVFQPAYRLEGETEGECLARCQTKAFPHARRAKWFDSSVLPEERSQREAWRYCPVNGIRICPEAAARLAAKMAEAPSASTGSAPAYDTSGLEQWVREQQAQMASASEKITALEAERQTMAAGTLNAMKDAQAAVSAVSLLADELQKIQSRLAKAESGVEHALAHGLDMRTAGLIEKQEPVS